MTLSISQNYTAVVPNSSFAQFLATGGVSPYSYQVLAGGAGGTIDASTGIYSAPPSMTAYPPSSLYDMIEATDSTSATVTSQILVATPLFLLCDIIQTQMNLDSFHCFLWDQKIFQPTDSNLYVVVSMQSCKPFGNSSTPLPTDGSQVQQFVSMYAKMDLDIISRGPYARDQKEFVVMALNSTYSQQQQEANGFYIGKVPILGGFVNLSQVDGAAIPYRYRISFAMQYQANITQSVDYYDSFTNPPQVYTNP